MPIMPSLKVCTVAILLNAFQTYSFLYEKPHSCLVNCTSRLMSEIFRDGVVVYVILEDDINSILAHQTGNSYILVDPFNNITKTELSYGGINWLIQAKSEKSLVNILDGLNASTIWHRTISPGGKFLIILTATNASTAFLNLWEYGILDAVVVTFDNNSATYHTSTPHIKGNDCGRKATIIESRECVQEITIRFGNDIRNFGKCLSCAMVSNVDQTCPENLEIHMSLLAYVQMVLIASHLHLGLIFDIPINWTSGTLKKCDMAIIFTRLDIEDYNKFLDMTVGESGDNFLWIYTSKEISKIESITDIFQIETWIVIVIFLLLKAVCWWFFLLNEDTRNKLEKCFVTFTDIIALLLGVGVNRVPNVTAMKWLLVIYLIYFIHIQVAFTANFYNLLTVPKYEDQIRSVDNLANSNIKICLNNCYKRYFEAEEPLESIYSKIKRKISYNDDDYDAMFNRTVLRRECATLVTEFQMMVYKNSSKVNINTLNDKLIKHGPLAIKIVKGSYMMRTFNKLIMILRESGIIMNRQKKHRIFYEELYRPYIASEDVNPLNLEQMHFSFVIFAVGCCFATIVFLLELAIHHFKKRYNE